MREGRQDDEAKAHAAAAKQAAEYTTALSKLQAECTALEAEKLHLLVEMQASEEQAANLTKTLTLTITLLAGERRASSQTSYQGG